ncbi:MAG: DNA (cytosine-5-)-methyltransferase [Clostridiales bacterium]|nr:DNA (cytosine-5-)-methyltransferase [Clostridiales bacterium]
MANSIKFIDLFAGIGGIRQGFELACKEKGFTPQCVFTSEIKQAAIKVLKQNHPNETIYGDITQIDANTIPKFDILLAGFPCQAFSVAGKRLGFEDTRGTLFFEVARILSAHKPYGFILENVEGLVTHDKEKKTDKIGKTLKTILNTLTDLGYNVSWKVLNAKNFGIAQDRKRIYIVGTIFNKPNLDNFNYTTADLDSILEQGLPLSNSNFVKLLLSHYSIDQLYGKSIKDKRGGNDNIHSWDIDYKGKISNEEKSLLNIMLKERRKKKWAEMYGIQWMDGMPLTIDFIRTFYDAPNLEKMLEHLVALKYLRKEYPKQIINNKRVQDETLPIGYNIVSGKMSFEVGKILDPNSIAPTLVAMDMQHLFVVDGKGIRPLSLREGLRLFGYPDNFIFDVTTDEGYDLLGNTVVVPVIKAVAEKLLENYTGD